MELFTIASIAVNHQHYIFFCKYTNLFFILTHKKNIKKVKPAKIVISQPDFSNDSRIVIYNYFISPFSIFKARTDHPTVFPPECHPNIHSVSVRRS